MHVRAITFAAVAAALLLPAAAAADVPHSVKPGESLSSIAATDGLSVDALAAANGLSATAGLTVGQVIEIPPQSEAAGTTEAATSTTATTQSTSDTTAASSTVSTETESGTSSSAGSVPVPTAERVSGAEIAEIADAGGVPPALAEAIGWQESGWNNDEVSSIGAVGVMQIIPSSWTWIDEHLTPDDPLQPASASENVRAGVLLLHELLSLTGDNYATAVAAYYQGLSSVERYGMYSSTRVYVNDVLSLEHRL
jgi:soluble lytic murein transglycosylase-like protein